MKIINTQTIAAEKMASSIKTNIKTLITKNIQTQSANLHICEMQAGGFTPMHKHPEEHQMFILEGNGVIFDGKELNHFHAGDAVFIESNELHLIKNNTKNPLHFLST